MSKTPFLRFLLVLLLALPFVGWGQSKNYYLTKSDTVRFTLVNDTLGFWSVNKALQVWHSEHLTEFWRPVQDYTFSDLDEELEIWSIPNQLRIWVESGNLSVWKYDTKVKEWSQRELAKEFLHTDSLQIWFVDDSTVFATANKKRAFWKRDHQTYFWSNLQSIKPIFQLNDTTQFAEVDSIQCLQLYKDNTQLWTLDLQPPEWKLSPTATIWTLLPGLEVWKAGNKINIWSASQSRDSWHINDTLQLITAYNKRLWLVNNEIKVIAMGDSVQIWRLNKEAKVWNLSPNAKAWHYIPPEVKKPILPPVVQTPVEAEEKIRVLEMSKHRQMWVVDDKTRILQMEFHCELWRKHQTQKWVINDSNTVWTVADTFRITQISQRIRFWHKKNEAKQWTELNAETCKIPETTNAWRLSPTFIVSREQDEVAAWSVSRDISVARKSTVQQHWNLDDSTRIWQLNDSLIMEQHTRSQLGKTWKRNKFEELAVNDSTLFWIIDPSTRISRIGKTVNLWRNNLSPLNRWYIDDSNEPYFITDTIEVLPINEKLMLWRTPTSSMFWALNPQSEVFRLRDSTWAWTYYRPKQAKPEPEPSFWKVTGQIKLNTYQNQQDNWAQGGDNAISAQAESKVTAIYQKKKISWETWLELRYGLSKPGENAIRKTDDKIELDSRFSFKKNSRWNYSFFTNAKTQFTDGIDYTKNLKISDFLAPLYFKSGLGLDFVYYKMFQLYLSPITIKLTYVRDTSTVDQQKWGIANNAQTLNETGAYLNGKFATQLTKTVRLESKFNFFSNYFHNPQNIDVDCFVQVFFDISKFIVADVSFQFIYDDDILVPIYETSSGTKIKIGESPRLQFREATRIGFYFIF